MFVRFLFQSWPGKDVLLFVAVLPVKQLNRTRVNVTQWNQQHLRNVCSRLKFLSKPLISDSQFLYVSGSFDFYVSDRHQYFYCVTPKVACTSWLLALLTLTGKRLSKIKNVHNPRMTDKFLKRAVLYEPRQRQMMLEKYYKFMFVREPLERLVSAYRDKCIKRPRCRETLLQSPSTKTGETARCTRQTQQWNVRHCSRNW